MKRNFLLMLLLTLLPFVGWGQTDWTEVGTLDALAEGFANGGNYKLTANLATEVDGISMLTVAQNQVVTLDLNGHSLTCNKKVIVVESGAALTITESVTPSGSIISIEDCAVSFKKGETASGAYVSGSGAEGATITITGGNFQAQESCVITSWSHGNVVNITGGTFTSIDNAVLAGNGTNGCDAHIWNVEGGTFNGGITSANYIACGIYAPNNDTWNITGGTFNVTGGAGIVQRAGEVNVGGTAVFNVTGEEGVTGKVGDSRFQVPCSDLVFEAVSDYPGLDNGSDMKVTGGGYASEVPPVAIVYEEGATTAKRISVSGGKFSSAVDDAYLADGCYNKEIDEEPYNYSVDVYSWNLTRTSLPYNAQNQIDDVKNCVELVPSAGDVRPDIKIYADANGATTPLTEVKNVGTYYIKVSMGNKQLGGLKPFKITAYTLTIGSSVTYKQIGDPDPEPKYSLIYDNAMSTEAANLIIEGLKLVRQQNPVTGIAPDPKDDKVDDQIRYYIDMNSATITGVENAENNYAIGTSSVDGILVVTKKVVNNEQFTVTVADNDLVYDGLEKRPAVTITYNNAAAGIENKDVTDQFTIGYNNNINADAYGENSGTTAEPVYAWINGEEATTNAKVTVHPKDESDYTESLMIAGQPVNGTISDKAFKIRQRDINEANLAAIDPVIFKNQEWQPKPKVSLTRNGNDDLVLREETDFTYAWDNNIYVSEEAEVKVEAVKVDGKYSRNFWNKKNENYFTIKPFKFTLKPVDNHKTLGDVDPVVSAEEGFAVTAIPAADMKDAEDNTLTMPQAVEDIATWDKPVTRSEGEFVAVYDITITNAALKTQPLVDGKPLSAPSNNYRMNDEKGAFEIVFASDYYVSSKYTTREYKSQDPSVPDNGFYLYKKVGSDYVEILATDDLYKEIAASGRIQGNQLKGQTIDGSVQAVLNGNKIEPKIVNEEGVEYDYTIDVLGEDYYKHTTGEFEETPEGILYITPRKITILAEDKTTAFGEDYATLTYKVYNGHVDAADATKVLDGTVDVDGDGNLDNFTVNTSNQYGPNTIARFGGLASNIQTLVNQAPKPLTANVTADIEAQNQATTTRANPNYDIKFVKGTYKVTPSGKTVFVDLAVTKNYGDAAVVTKTVTKRIGTTKDGAVDYTSANLPTDAQISYVFMDGDEVVDEPTEVDTYDKEDGFTVVGADNYTLPASIDGYPVVYDGTLTINKGGEVVIAVKTLVYNYPVEPLLSFDANRVKITGATFAQIAANATEEKKFALTYTKPAVGFIKNGADIQVTFDGKPYGTPEGQVVSADDWAWVANYTKVTVKSGTLRVTAPDEITLDIVAFNSKYYDEAADVTDQLIKDYHGTEVSKVNVVASKQDTSVELEEEVDDNPYTVKGNQWYSMVLPFDATPRQIQKIFNGFVNIDVLDQTLGAKIKAGDIRFKSTVLASELTANTPFIAKTDNDFKFAPTEITANEGKILIQYPVDNDGEPTVPAVSDTEGNQFIGTYQRFLGPDNDGYDMFNLKNGKISPVSVGTYIRPLGAYIKVADGVHNVRVFIEEADGTITAINGVNAETMSTEGVYNLSGQRVSRAQKGIFIKDGKKVLVK